MEALQIVIYVLICLIIYYILAYVYKIFFHYKFNEIIGDPDYEPYVIITGGNAGIGFETVKGVFRHCAKATVVMTTRDVNRGERAKEEIVRALLELDPKRYSSVADRLLVRQLDLSSFASVRKFTEQMRTELPRLDILILNAGIIGPPKREMSADGLELTIATNHFGHFLLTLGLLELLRRAQTSPATASASVSSRAFPMRQPRIVVVSSLLYTRETTKHLLENYNFEMPDTYKGSHKAYCASKLANVLFTFELAERLRSAGDSITVNVLCPGLVNTGMLEKAMNSSKIFRLLVPTLIFFMIKSPESGAQCSLYCALSSKLEGVSGRYLDNLTFVKPNPGALDREAARAFWRISEERTGAHFN